MALEPLIVVRCQTSRTSHILHGLPYQLLHPTPGLHRVAPVPKGLETDAPAGAELHSGGQARDSDRIRLWGMEVDLNYYSQNGGNLMAGPALR